MSGEVPEFDVSRILFLVSLRQSENNECFLNGKKWNFFFKKATKQSNGLMKILLCTAESTLWTMAEP